MYENEVIKNNDKEIDPKIIDLIRNGEGDILASLEYFPPRTEEGVQVCDISAVCFVILG